MTNHVHRLVTPERAASIPRFIIALGQRYVPYLNTTYRRTGTLWDSRYQSALIQAETYRLNGQLYLERRFPHRQNSSKNPISSVCKFEPMMVQPGNR